MKRILLFVLTMLIGVATMAQLSRMNNPRLVKAVPATAIDIPFINPTQGSNSSVNSKSVLEDNLGQTRYDLQTNESIQNRLCVFPDGTMAGTWTTSAQDATFSDRGTGYNYFNGTNWMPLVTTRIETVRAGWPSIEPWNGGGEIVVTHQSATTQLVKCTRTVKGTGAWTQSLIPKPTGVSGLVWPRTITSGPSNNYIHIVVCSGPTGNGGTVYKGLDPALLYYRSLDGGATWDKLAIQLPGLDSSNYKGFAGDEYAWGSPKGDTIYFAVGGSYTDTFIMKSTDNGDTWTKIPILSNGHKKIPAGTTYLAPWKSVDGAVACEMDLNGVIHFSSGVGGGFVEASTQYIQTGFNGLIYWNTTMPMLRDSLNLDTLDVHGQLLGYYSDGPNPGDTLNTVTSYRIALTSFPQISIDAANNLYVIYSGVTWENPSPEGINYRHIFGRAKFHDKATWSSDPIDLNAGILYYGQEFVFASMAKRIANDKLRILYQTADQPGTAVGTTGTTGSIAFHDNFMQYREIPGNTFWPTGIDGNLTVNRNPVSQNYPNPVNGITYFNVNLDKGANVTVEVSNIMGQKIMNIDKGFMYAGVHRMTIDGTQLSSGIYFYTVKINNETFTHKMIVE
ncbi:MAG: T9SS type A sorting domain-containing protein [Bacteroidota bacterium]